MSPEDFASNSFDYVICGGGTAGLVIAARLTEDPNITVGVLEAGENRLNDPLVDGPNTFMQLFGKDEYDWRYKTVAQVSTRLIYLSFSNDLARKAPKEECMGGSVAKPLAAHLQSISICFPWLQDRT